MIRFEKIRKMAAKRKGGAMALEERLPEVKTPKQLESISDDRWLAQMTKRIFQAGFVWKVVENKWDGFEAAFQGFDPGRLSLLADDELDRLASDKRIVRNGQKIATVCHNAGLILDLAKEHGSAAACFANWPDDDFVGLLAMLKKKGSRLGGNTAQVFLRSMGKDSFILSGDVVAALIEFDVVDKTPTSKKDMAAVQAAFNQWRAESDWPLTHVSRVLACCIDT